MAKITASAYSFVNSLSNSLNGLFIKLAEHTNSLDIIFIRGIFTVLVTYFFIQKADKEKSPGKVSKVRTD